LTEIGLISFLLAAGAALLVGFSKTGIPGAALPAVALMAEAFGEEQTKLSVGAMLPLLLVGDVFALAYYRRHAHWTRLWELLPWVVVGMVPGYLVLWLIHGSTLRVLLGAIILALLAVHLSRQRTGREASPDRWWFASVAGGLAGFGTTIGNAAGPVFSIYLVSRRLDKHEFLGTAAWFFFLVNLSKIPPFALMGVMNSKTLSLDLAIAPALVIGAFSGAWLLRRIPQAVFDAFVLGLAALAAVRMVLS
jgi:uncharacterized membrane protein YfcA